MAQDFRTQIHIPGPVFEDLLIVGGSQWRSGCSCGWVSRAASSSGVAVGLWRRHVVLAGRH